MKKINYDKYYKNVVSVKVNQSQFTLYGCMTFYDGINQTEDGCHHQETFNYGLDYPEDEDIVNDVILRIEKYLEEIEALEENK